MTKEQIQKNPRELDGVPDLCQLEYLQETNVLHNLKVRYEQGKIYTSTTSKVLVAVNPYEKVVGNDSEETMAKYHQAPINLEGLMTEGGLEPHVFNVAHAAYHNMCSKQANQSVIVCGESGSGKTESAKLFMKFLAYTSTKNSSRAEQYAEASKIGKQILDANPILESFGNAQTKLNDNSSRFGKFTKMLFQPQQDSTSLTGAQIETYLLEKSRVVFQEAGERNYHAFYHLLASPEKQKEFALGQPDDFHYLKGTSVTLQDESNFAELVEAMNTLSFTKQEQNEVFRTVAGILHLGNVSFTEGKNETCTVSNASALATTAKFLDVEADKLQNRLTTRTITMQGQVIVKPLSKRDAETNRDSIAKALYNGVFLWIVERINKESVPKTDDRTSWIGTLDVFGFEIFENNSFEQFCINFANERLQQFFNFHVLKMEQDLYRREALLWTPLDLPENQDVIDLIASRPHGIFPLLDSACLQPKGNDMVFTANMFEHNKYNSRLRQMTLNKTMKSGGRFDKFNGFTVKHYAGEVNYDAKEFLAKNMDSAHPDTLFLFDTSTSNITKTILTLREGSEHIDIHQTKQKGQKFKSTSYVFNEQLVSLMKTLEQTTPYFVRCVKPNEKKAPKNFVSEYVRPQLRCGGLVEALRIIKCGFPTRCSYERMHNTFGSILDQFHTITNLNKRDFTEAIINICGNTSERPDRSQYQLGLTMIFFRPGQQKFFQSILKIKPTEITMQQCAEIHRFLIQKRIRRMAGTIKAYLRMQHFLVFRRIQRAATIMNIIGKTMIRSLSRIRKVVAWRQEEADKVRLAKDDQYQKGLKAMHDLELMKQTEMRLKSAIKMEKENAKQCTEDAHEKIALYTKKIKSLTEELNAVQQEVADNASQAKIMERKWNESTKELDATQRDLSAQSQQIKDLEAALEIAKGDLQQTQDEMSKELSNSRTEVATLQNSLCSVQVEMASLKETNEQLQAQLEREINDNRTTKQMLSSNMEEKDHVVSELTGRVTALQEERTQLEQRMAAASRTSKQQLEEHLQSSEDEMAILKMRLEGEIAELNQRIDTLKQEKRALDDQLQQVTTKFEGLEQQLARMTRHSSQSEQEHMAQLTAKDDELNELRNAQKKTKDDNKAGQAALQKVEAEYKQHVARAAKQLAEATQMHETAVEEAEKAANLHKGQLTEANTSISQLTAEVAETKQTLVRVQQQGAKEMASKDQNSARELSAKAQEIEDLTAQLEILQNRLNSAQRQADELNSNMLTAENAKREADEEFGSELERLRRQMATMATKLAEAQDRMAVLESDLDASKNAINIAEAKFRSETNALCEKLEESEENAIAIEERMKAQAKQSMDAMDDIKADLYREIDALTREIKLRDTKHKQEVAAQAEELFKAREEASKAGATEEEVAAWEMERTDLREQIDAGLAREENLTNQLAKTKSDLRSKGLVLEGKQSELAELQHQQQRKEADFGAEMRKMQRKFERRVEEAKEEQDAEVSAAESKARGIHIALDTAVARENAMKSEMAAMREEMMAMQRQVRQQAAKQEAKTEAMEQEHKTKLRRTELEFERKLREAQAQVQDVLDTLANKENIHRLEVQAVEDKYKTMEAERVKDAIPDQDTQARLAEAEELVQHVQDMQECYGRKEANFMSQIDELTRALSKSNLTSRRLTMDNEEAAANFARERDMLLSQSKVVKMQAEADAEAAAIEHTRQLRNAEADNTMLRSRLHRLGWNRLSTHNNNVVVHTPPEAMPQEDVVETNNDVPEVVSPLTQAKVDASPTRPLGLATNIKGFMSPASMMRSPIVDAVLKSRTPQSNRKSLTRNEQENMQPNFASPLRSPR